MVHPNPEIHVRILVTGGTGVLGRLAVPLLVADGNDVFVATRSPRNERGVATLGATPLPMDVWDAARTRHDLERVRPAAVIRLTTAVPRGPRMAMRRAWRTNDRVRRDLAGSLAAAAATVGARYVGESIAFAYRDAGRSWIDETSPLHLAAHTRSIADAEAAAHRLTTDGGVGVSLRFGLFVGPGTDLDVAVREQATHGRFALPGSFSDHVPFVDVRDAASAVVAGLHVGPGTYNVCEDDPATRGAHAAALARVVGREVRPAPVALRALPVVRALARSQRVDNGRLRGAGWKPTHRAIASWHTHLEATRAV